MPGIFREGDENLVVFPAKHENYGEKAEDVAVMIPRMCGVRGKRLTTMVEGDETRNVEKGDIL